MYHYLKEIKDKHKGNDIYVIGSGASMNFVDKSFFANKLCIGINLAHKFYCCKYSVIKDIVTRRGLAQHLAQCEQSDSIMITTQAHMGGTHLFKTKRYEYYVFPEDEWNGFVRIELVGTDKIVNSHSTITSAMHVAFYLGAANIILCGVDCGLLDGKANHDKYYEGAKPQLKDAQKRIMSHPYHLWNVQAMRIALKKHGCNVYALNPFLTMDLEGHKYTRLETPETELWAGKKELPK